MFPEVTLWPQPDMQKLISKIKRNIPPKDTRKFTTRIKKIDWKSVTFDSYTAEQCRQQWGAIQERQRRHRLLAELVQDAKKIIWELASKKTNYKRGESLRPKGNSKNSKRKRTSAEETEEEIQPCRIEWEEFK